MAGKLELNFSHAFKYNIWKIHAFAECDYLIVELRNHDNLSTAFAIYDSINHRLIEEGILPQETWWISVARASNEEVVFYTFDSDKNPTVNEYLLYNIKEANVVQRSDSSEEIKLLNVPSDENKSISSPFHYQSTSEHFDTVRRFMNEFMNHDIVAAVDYMERDLEVVVSYYKKKEKGLDNNLLILTRDKQVLLMEKLGADIDGISDNTFFVKDNNLIFVKDLREIFIYQLSQN